MKKPELVYLLIYFLSRKNHLPLGGTCEGVDDA